ncbi:hypothetical protein PUMCH_001825 [Australozyma saopauloensis]|uniref:Methyltransferase type 11 domain-containing protein n=1 Tax=Australozyma saopauloensis TaxID=291208 RepID=A0AAX4H7U7_9ASCO|nr:hypothetical protein PUMCH_001825 [[Candida] saopauloensis]
MFRQALLGSKVARTLVPRSTARVLGRSGINLVPLRTYADRFDINKAENLEARRLKSLPKTQQWAQYFQTTEFKKMMTKYYVGMFAVLLIALYYYMNDKYKEEKHLKKIRRKYHEDRSSLSEYEFLKLKLTSGIKLKPREEKKFELYTKMRRELLKNGTLETLELYDPTPEDLEEWYSKQEVKKVVIAGVSEDSSDGLSGKAAVKTSTIEMLMEETPEGPLTNLTNPKIQPALDTTDLFDDIAAEYDDSLKWEERGILMGMRRKWLMNKAEGHVLEVACGTGRNIPYFNPLGKIDSITYMDSAPRMVEICQKKFREKYPNYRKAAFAVGKAENMDTLNPHQYDTVIEAFGLCAYEDPVKALRNMTRVLKPGGRLILLEHGRTHYDFLNNHLDFRSEKRMKTWGCRWNLDIGEIVEDAGLDITYEKHAHFGSTWMLICKRPEDPMRLDEKPFLKKLLGSKMNTVDRGDK